MARFIFMIQEIQKKLTRDNITGFAAQACFYILLSFVPCIIVLMSLVRYLPVTPDTMISVFQGVAPTQLMPIIETTIFDVYNSPSTTITSLTAIGTVWAAGKSFMAIINGLNIIYETEKTYNWLIKRIISTIYTVIFLVILIISLMLLVFGIQLLHFTSIFSSNLTSLIESILNNKIIIFPCILILVFMAIYNFIPRRKSSLAAEFPGAVIAAIGWCGFSSIYSYYVNHAPNFSYMYGSLTTLIFALIWIYSCMLIFFFGAEFNILLRKKYLNPILPASMKRHMLK